MKEKGYHRQKIEILIDRDSELYGKLVARAKRDGVSVESVVDMLLTIGSNPLLEKRLDAMERMEKERKNG